MQRVAVARVLAVLGLGAALVSCGREEVAVNEDAPEAAAAPAAAIIPPFTINELMVMIVDRPGELLWDAEKEGRAPKTAEDWYMLENHSVDLASAATLIKLGGTGPSDMGWVRDPLWQSTSQQLVDAALKARGAARAKNFDALVKYNGEIVDACEACHKVFKPDIPTGGLFMHQRPAGVPPRI